MATKKTTPETRTSGKTPRAPRKMKSAAAAKPEASPSAQAAAPAAAPRKAEAAPRTRKPARAAAAEAPAPPAPQRSRPSRAAIAERAAAIWRERGGTPFDNWIEAESELGG